MGSDGGGGSSSGLLCGRLHRRIKARGRGAQAWIGHGRGSRDEDGSQGTGRTTVVQGRNTGRGGGSRQGRLRGV